MNGECLALVIRLIEVAAAADDDDNDDRHK